MKIGKLCMLLAVLTMLWGCSSDSDDGDKLEGSSFAPAGWSAPITMGRSPYFRVCPAFEEEPGASDDDKMTAFIGDECRAKPAPLQKDYSGKCYFVLNIHGNSTDRDVPFSLCYYAAKIHHLFKLNATQTFVPSIDYGIDKDFVPQLIKGSSRYPVQGDLTVKLPDTAPRPDSQAARHCSFHPQRRRLRGSLRGRRLSRRGNGRPALHRLPHQCRRDSPCALLQCPEGWGIYVQAVTHHRCG